MRPSDASRRREAILVLALAGFNAGISLHCVEPMLPKLAVEFNNSVSAAAMSAFAFAYAGAVPVRLYTALVNRLMRALGERGLVLAADAPGRLLFLAVAVAPH